MSPAKMAELTEMPFGIRICVSKQRNSEHVVEESVHFEHGVCQIEKLMWHAFKKHDGKVVVASSMELKAKDISCFGWEVRRNRMV